MEKLNYLKNIIKSYGKVAVAFSGGVDSTFLMAICHEVLGKDNVKGYFVSSDLNASQDLFDVNVLGEMHDWNYEIVEFDLWGHEEIVKNSPNRCYYCKKALLTKLIDRAKADGYKHIVEGTNASDVEDFRPGLRAIEELTLESPLKESGLTKEEIRELSKKLYDLPTWNKPSSACLASRIPYGTSLSEENLKKVEEGENFLTGLGYYGCRVRYYGDLARIELDPKDFKKFLEQDRFKVHEAFKELGFIYTTLDILGYQVGSTNLVLEDECEDTLS